VNRTKLSFLLGLAATCGIVAGRTFGKITRSPSPVIAIPANRNLEAKSSTSPHRPAENKNSNSKILTVAQMSQESEKEWHVDHTYMRYNWFGGSQAKINKVNDIIRRDFCEMPQRLESADAKRLFLNAQTDEEKRFQYHLWTKARLYEMIRVLEIAKKHQLLTRTNQTPSKPEIANSDTPPDPRESVPTQPAVERTPHKTYQ
jgi:hypothetical protein